MHYKPRRLCSARVRAVSCAAAVALFSCLGAGRETLAQSPNAAASGQAKSDEGFYPGWTLGTRFEGSTSGDGSIFDLGVGVATTFRIISASAWEYRTISLAHPQQSSRKTRRRCQVQASETWDWR